MTDEPTVAPVLSTEPEYAPAATVKPSPNKSLSDEEFADIFEIARTTSFVQENGYKRVALQFPDDLLPDSTRVVDMLSRPEDLGDLSLEDKEKTRFYVLGDTSYGSCCVDEIAAEHADADAVVHYGRACLSPTARLPVLHIFTNLPLPLEPIVEAFKSIYTDVTSKVVIMSSLPYTTSIPKLSELLRSSHGYENIFATEVVHKPEAPIPNRTNPSEDLSTWSIFHIGEPIPSLVLTLSSRVESITVYDTTTKQASGIKSTPMLRRRYALLNSVRVSGIIGILVNTLSATNYLPVITSLKKLLREHGKKSYLFVVGKVNVAKISNFSEIECWVVVGCWESSLLDTQREFYAPCVTPWEVKVALEGGEGADVTGWRTDYEEFLHGTVVRAQVDDEEEDERDEDESARPVFDMHTGKLVYTSAPMRAAKKATTAANGENGETSLITTNKDQELAKIGGEISPAAAYLRDKRQWRGLGSDFDETPADEDGAILEVGRDGIARGYKWNGGDKT